MKDRFPFSRLDFSAARAILLTAVCLLVACVSADALPTDEDLDTSPTTDVARDETPDRNIADRTVPDTGDDIEADPSTDAVEDATNTDLAADQTDSQADLGQDPVEDGTTDQADQNEVSSDLDVDARDISDVGDLVPDKDGVDDDSAADLGADPDVEPDIAPTFDEPECLSDADCLDPGTPVCSLVAGTYGYTNRCIARVGAGDGGSPCFGLSPGLMCETGHCLFGSYCQAPCLTSDDCAEGECRALTLTVDDRGTPLDVDDDVTQSFDLCIPVGTGSLAPCDQRSDCPPLQACGIHDDALLGLQTRCRGLNLLGEREGFCDIGFECSSSNCIGGSFCHWPCHSDSDCSLTDCFPVNLENATGHAETFRSCIPPCVTNDDCDSGEFCSWFQDVEPENELIYLCGDQVSSGSGLSGAECSTNNDCISNLCLTSGVCLGACNVEDNAGCATDTFCYEDSFFISFDPDTPEDATDDALLGMNTCSADRGSWDLCTADVGCGAGEFCEIRPNGDVTAVASRCVTAEGDSPAGSFCDVDEDCASGDCDANRCFGLCTLGSEECADGSSCQRSPFRIDFFADEDSSNDILTTLNVCR